jgi:hypothetical protein
MMVARDPESGGRIAFAIPVGVLSRDSSVVQATLPTPMELDGAAGSHLDASARGVKAGEAGWLFTGRKRALSDLVAWLTSDDRPAIRAVTGTPGCGKSAVLARLVTISDRRYRARIPEFSASDPTVPAVGAIDVTFHAKDHTAPDFIDHAADVCQLEAGDVPGVLIAIGALERGLVMVIDARRGD